MGKIKIQKNQNSEKSKIRKIKNRKSQNSETPEMGKIKIQKHQISEKRHGCTHPEEPCRTLWDYLCSPVHGKMLYPLLGMLIMVTLYSTMSLLDTADDTPRYIRRDMTVAAPVEPVEPVVAVAPVVPVAEPVVVPVVVEPVAPVAAVAVSKREMRTMVVVLSRRSSFETRSVIRETWGSGHDNVFFAVGACCSVPPSDRVKWTCTRARATSVEDQSRWDSACVREDTKLSAEARVHSDMLRMSEVDVYRHLPQKLKFAYAWGLSHTTADWFLKTDDDSVVRIDTLDDYLSRTYDASGAVVVGRIMSGARVPRGGKWAEPHYTPSVYPKFPLGSVGHVVSRPVVSYVVANSDALFNYQGEDVSLGIWLDESPLKSGVSWVTSKHMSNHGNCRDTGMWVMGHNIKPSTMRACFAHKDEMVRPSQDVYVGVRLRGGLGNNLFQLASIIGIAERNKATPCYTGTNKAVDFVETRITKCPGGHFATQKERGYARFTPFDIRQSTKISEYLQSYKYFADMPPFVVKPSMRTFAQTYIRSHSNAKTNVGIHVRRGDHLKYGYLRFPSSQYFENAMEYFRNKYQDVQFFVASNDIAWCQKNPLFRDAHIISGAHSGVEDMAILANCDHVIVSLGTFGWWSGMLSGGEVVYNADEFDMQHDINKGKVVKTDYYPPEWIQLSAAPVAEKSQWETNLPASNSKNDYCPKKGSSGALWIRQQYSNIPKKNTCKTQKRIGGKGDGGKIVCLDAIEKDNCVVYSLGSRLDFSFENDVVTQLGCEVHTFDCTVGSPSDTPSGVSFHPWCIGGSDTKKRISSDLGHGGEIGQYYTLETIMSMLHHDKINLLKMDIERHEFDVFRTLRTFPDQIVFETHLHNAYDMFGRPVSEQEWSAMWKKLQKYNVFAHEPNPLCLCCCEWSIVLPPKHTNTIVTAYFEMNSKHAKSKYNTWMKNMLSFQDAMVIFTSPDLVSKMESLRAHAMDRTKIISMKLSDTMLVSNYSMDLWKNQFDMDTEKALHKSYELFWLWLSKSWFVTQAIEMNPFSSDVFVWSDIGCFRDTTYNGKKWLQKTNIIPDSAILFAAWTQPQKQRSHWVEKTNYPPFSKSGGLFLAGAQFAGYVKTWEMFHASFLKTLEGYVVRGLFFGDDQAVMQSTCLQNPSLCAFVTPDKVHGSKWFGLQDALHGGGKLYYRDNALLFWLPSPSIKRPKRRGLLCTLVKDEPEQLVQTWVKHHENLGFDVVVYDHGSTNRVTSSVQMIPFTQNALPCTQSEDSERCSKLKKCQQWMAATSTKDHGFAVCQVAAYADCLERYGADYEWFGNWDIDEYVFRTNQHANDQPCISAHPATKHRLDPAFTAWHGVMSNMPFNIVMHAGTLLGYVRDCDIIPTTGDLDFTISNDAFTPANMNRLVAALRVAGFKGPTKVLGNIHEQNIEISFNWRGSNIDIFVEYMYNTTHRYVAYHNSPPDGYWRKIIYRDSPVKTTIFKDVNVHIPSDMIQRVEDLYGSNWRFPVLWENNGKAGGYAHQKYIQCGAVKCRGWDFDKWLNTNEGYETRVRTKKRVQSKDISPPDFWSLVESLGDSIQLQCLKFGPRRIDTTTFEGDPLKHLWRAPYKHLGEEINCHARVCENVGSEKTLTRISAIQSVLVHKHVLKSGTLRPWMDVTGIRCNHYAFRSKNYVAQKSKKNKNAFLNTQLKTSVFDKTGWFNSIYDDGFGRAQTPEIPHICVAFLSCKRLSYLKQTYAGVRQLVQNENTFKFTFSIVDNGSDDETKKWIHEQSFDHAILLDRNVGIAKAMDMLWASCGDAPYILNVEDDWSFNKKSIRGVLKESVSILDTHSDVLEVWLRSHGRGFQFMPGKTKSINNQIQRRLPVVAAKPLNYYTAWSSKSQFPWWGSYTNGATLKHAKRLKRVGPMSQKSCGDEGNCESEFASKITHLGFKSARLCWNNDSCEKSWNNEPENKVMFEHRGYKRSPGHMETTTEMPKQDKNKQQRQHMTPQTDDIGWIRFNGGDWPRISKHDIYKSIHCTFPKNLQLHLLHGYYLCADGTKSSHSHLPVPSYAATNMVQDSLEELKLLDELASENNIPYSLHAGSLLSFSRAQIYNVSDVIPWDDDVDLMIDKRFQPIILKAFMDGEHVAPISKDWTTKKVRGFFMLTRSNVAPNKSFWFKIKVKNKFYSNDLGGLDIVFVEEKNGNYLKMKGPNTNWKDLSQTGHMPNIPRFDNIIRRPLGNATTYAFDLSIAEPWLIKSYGKIWRWPIFPDLQKYCKSQSNVKIYVT
jgi:galactoside 2-L-fucosyltransferase 1/2